MARRFIDPPGIGVITDDGGPVRITWRGRRESVRVCNHWRLERSWWKGKESAVERQYYKLITGSGTLLVVYHDLGDGKWYLEKVVD